MNALEQQRRHDKRVYEEAVKFLLQFDGVTESVLEQYFQPESQPHSLSLGAIYERMLLSATNVGLSINTVKVHLGHAWGNELQREKWQHTKTKLCAFDPVQITQHYGTDANVWQPVWEDLNPAGAMSPPRTVQRFCQTVISAASFIAQFASADDFYTWVEFFNGDTRARAALPMLIANEVFGYGFALACDFVKDLGYTGFPKPDVHLKDICGELGLCAKNADDYVVYRTVIRAAENAGVTAYQYDRVLYLIGSGDLFHHPILSRALAAMPNRKRTFITQVQQQFQLETKLAADSPS